MPAALVTGSSRGIGRAIAERFARDGYDVVVNYVSSAQKARAVAESIGEKTDSEAVAVRADVGDPEEAADLVDAAVEAFGGLAHVVNNAGVDQHVYTEALSPEDFDAVMDTNVNGAFNVTKAALPHLREAAETTPDEADDADPAPTPSVTNVSSILAHTGAPVECHYAASKAGILGLTKSHAGDFAPDVRVNAIAPGHVETDMTADRTEDEKEAEMAEIPVERFGQPRDIADAAAYLRDAGFVTGETLNVNGGELMR
ncbi:3-oxoacyl-ACP reductase FabG [Halorussus gelatinilyticus]|uniref:3-oxoacyl-ACP reductase FabG n=1 Tax=Halorussus gelatinilyticus TaxID=2937524 RepID=A0A8U0IJ35_9EURY|nr:3-oxoacyl-ACP reductase family protein [Halorussus gelatinilyticus]UPW00292.1 3-oxoacyl-ACP reductase FabG [Halorussus gelatinilyticus]